MQRTKSKKQKVKRIPEKVDYENRNKVSVSRICVKF